MQETQKTQVWALGWEDPREEGVATTPVFWPGDMDRGAWWAMVHRVAKSQIQLKWLNMHASTYTYIHTYIYIHTHTHIYTFIISVLWMRKLRYSAIIYLSEGYTAGKKGRAENQSQAWLYTKHRCQLGSSCSFRSRLQCPTSCLIKKSTVPSPHDFQHSRGPAFSRSHLISNFWSSDSVLWFEGTEEKKYKSPINYLIELNINYFPTSFLSLITLSSIYTERKIPSIFLLPSTQFYLSQSCFLLIHGLRFFFHP